MEDISQNNGEVQVYRDFLIKYFNDSNSFDQSKSRIRNIADCLRDKITLQQAKRLLNYSNSNSQIYYSWNVPDRIIEIVKNFETDIDKNLYENIYKE